MKVLLINQAFYPDVNATGQYLTDLAEGLAERGHRMTVIAGDRQYEDPAIRYQCRETYKGIDIIRIPCTGFGKRTKWMRMVGAMVFQIHLSLKLIFLPKQDTVVGLTAPPFVACLGLLFCRLKGGKFVYWVMDLNPDEAITAGWLKEKSFAARFLRRLTAWSFAQSDEIVVLDLFMKSRLLEKYHVAHEKISVIPPWAQSALRPIAPQRSLFRQVHGFQNKFVIMYSGNHSPCHPLDSLLAAALYYKGSEQVRFCFVGGGLLTRKVSEFKKTHGLDSVFQFPYQPLKDLSDCLSAADLHIVVMGDPYVGIIHPCKIYGILAVGRPFIYIGPRQSPIGEVVSRHGVGACVAHDDVQALIQAIDRSIHSKSSGALLLAGQESSSFQKTIDLKNSHFSQKKIMAELIALIE